MKINNTYVIKCRDLYVIEKSRNYFLTGLSFMATAKEKIPSLDVLESIAQDIGVDSLELDIIVREIDERKLSDVLSNEELIKE